MNSLAYLSRQFDVLASPRAPPSTPVLETAPLLSDPDAAATLKRVQTWSTKSLAAAASSASGSYSPWGLKRSYSSPADVQPDAQSAAALPPPPNARSPPPAAAPAPTRPASRRPSVSASEKALRPKLRSESLFRRVFFVHVLVALWHHLCGLWQSVRGRVAPAGALEEAAADDASDDEKDTEDEAKGARPPVLQVEQPPPIPPPILPAALAVLHPPLHRANSDTTVPLVDVKAPLDFVSPAPAPVTALARTTEQSRAPTPTLGARKTPLHLPKTLVLDLDETLIHSTSRPMNSPTSGSFLGSLGIGRRNRGMGHTVEVTLGGRSTLYHVYKRPFVDYFLRKVRRRVVIHLSSPLTNGNGPAGFGVVHARYIHGIYARVCRSCH